LSLAYRTVLRLPVETDLIRLAEHEIQTWIERGRKVDRSLRKGFLTGEYFVPGVYRLRKGGTFSVARSTTQSGSRGALFRLVEETKTGTWQVDVIAVDSEGGNARADLLVVEGKRLDETDSDDIFAPPRLVKQMLASETVLDSATPVTATPRLILEHDVDEVVEAITDPRRSVTVIVASSWDNSINHDLRRQVEQLTSELVGVSAVFVLNVEAANELNARLPASHRTQAGRVRTYLPRVNFDDPADGRRHRILGPRTFANAIRGGKVAPYLQKSFAYQTRSALLSAKLPSTLRRQLAVLEDQLAEFNRAAVVEQRLVEAKAEAARLAKRASSVKQDQVPASQSAVSDVVEIVRATLGKISRWLGREVEKLDVEVLEEADDIFARQQAQKQTLEEEMSRLEKKLETLIDDHQSLIEDYEFRGLELAEAESAAAKASDRARFLQGCEGRSGGRVRHPRHKRVGDSGRSR
jgi:hypothetical protein